MADMLNLKKVGGAARSLVGRMAIRAPDGANKTQKKTKIQNQLHLAISSLSPLP